MSRRTRLLLALPILAALLPAAPTAQSQHVRMLEDRDHVTVMEFGGVYDRQPEANFDYEQSVRQAIAREFLRTHADDYDFLVVFTRFNYELGSDSEGAQVGGRYYGVKNDTQGIGIEPFDLSGAFGSASGRLQGYIDMGSLARLATDPTDPRFEQTLSVLAHEFMHRWGTHVRFRNSDGTLNTSLLGREGSHWNFRLNTHNSVHYGQDWRDNGDGSFTAVGRAMSFYSPLDLYLMGMLDKTQVPPFFLIENDDVPATRLPEVGATISGTKTIITIDDVVAAEGERVPSAADAPKRFKMGFIFLVRPGEQAEGVELAAINHIREAFSTRALILTGGKGVVQVYPEQPEETPEPPTPIPPPTSGPRPGPVDLVQALDWLLSRQAVDGSFADSAATRVRDTSAVLEALAEVPAVFTSHQRAVAWLSQLQEHLNVDMVSRRLLAIRPQFSATDAAFLAGARNASGGWGLRRGYHSDPLDTALALLATPTSDDISRDVAYLVASQNADGGWSVKPGGASSVQATIAVLRLGERYGTNAALGEALTRGMAWLQSRQYGDGGFGDDGSTVYETAQAVLHLLPTTFPRTDIAEALAYLRSRQLADGSWNESAYQTALAMRALKVAELTNASIAASDITVSNASPIDGQQVTVRAMVSNDSVRELQNLTVGLFDGDPSAGGTQIGADVVIANLPSLSQIPVNFAWDTTDRAGQHRLFVVLDRQGQLEEFNEADNVASAAVVVRQPPVEPDLVVTPADIAFTPALLQALPQDQTVTATVANTGQTAAANVHVWLFEGEPSEGRRVGETTVSVPGRGHALATFGFQVTTAGQRRYYVVVDPDGQVAEADEANNQAFQTLQVQGTHDFVVAPGGIAFSENPTTLGRDLTVTADVRNQGTTDAFAVAVRIFIEDPAGTIDLASRVVDLPAGSTVPVSATWRTSRALAAVPVVVIVDPANAFPENAENNNRASAPLSVSSSTQANLHVTPQLLQVSTPIRQGGSATVSLTVQNTGATDASNVTVAFFRGAPASGGVQLGTTQVLPLVAAGGQAVATFEWTDIAAGGDTLIYATVDAANTVAEFDEGDNTAFVNVHVLTRPDLSVTPAAMSFSPAFPREGEPVVVSAVIFNGGEQAAPARVRFFDGDPARGGVAIGADQLIAQVPGLGQVTAQAAFASGGQATRTIYVQVDPLSEVVEQDEANNVAFRTLGVQNGSLYASSLYFSPNGDDIQDSTELFFRFDAPQAVGAVGVYDRARRLVRTIDLSDGDVVSGSSVWDGLDDRGQVVPDGPYDLAVLSPGGADLGRARVVVDTNRSPVGDALGTKFLLNTNLTCSLSTGNVNYGHLTVGWLPGDEGLVTMMASAAIELPGRSPQFHDVPVGVYVVTPDGETVSRITPDAWTVRPPAGNGTAIGHVAISPDGQRIVIGTRRYRLQSDAISYIGPIEVWVVNTDGSGLRKIAETPDQAGLFGVSLAFKWSPASDRVVFDVPIGSPGFPSETRLYVAPVDGSGATLVQTFQTNVRALEDYGWSPGGRLLYASYEAFEPTGEAIRLYALQPDGTGESVVATSVRDLDDLSNLYWIGDEQPVFRTRAQLTSEGYFNWGSTAALFQLSLAGAAPQLLSGSGRLVDVQQSPDRRALAFLMGSGHADEGSVGPVQLFVADGTETRLAYTSGPDTHRVSNLTWTTSGRRLSWIDYFITQPRTCTDSETGPRPCPVTRAAIATADLETGEVTSVPFGEEEEQFDPIGFFADGNSFVFEDDDRLVAVSVADGRRAVVLEDEHADFSDATFTPSGKYLRYQSGIDAFDQSRACWKGDSHGRDEFLLSSALNLTTQLAFKRDSSQLELRGTAEDANFASYVLEYAPVADASAWAPIGAAGEVSVINDLLAQWVPPAEGSFYVRLTASDKAGNVGSIRRRVAWGLTPTITNVTIAPRMFSPNGDGSRDSVTIDYFVLGPVNLEFAISNASGALVRTIAQSHASMGPASIAWDGRDGSGQFVAEGTYRLRVLDYDFFVSVDTAAPQATLTLGSGLHTIPQRIHCVDPANGTGCVVTPGPLVVSPYFELGGIVNDAQLASWRLEVGTGLNPTDWAFVAEGAANQAATRPFATLSAIDGVVNRQYRLTAIDQAGNRRVVTTGFAPEELILYAYDDEEVPTGYAIDQRLGQHVLSVAHTGRTPLQHVVVQHRLQGTVAWINGPPMSTQGGMLALPWDNSTLSPGRIYDVRVVSTDVNGAQMLSNAIAIRSNVFLFLNYSEELNAAFGLVTLSETITSVRLVFGENTDIGSGSTFNGQPEFTIGVAYDEQAAPCSSVRVPARFRAVGASGRVYYSNPGVVTRFPRPSQAECEGPLGLPGRLEVKIETAVAPACGLPAPGQSKITMLGGGVIDPKLFMQRVLNGPLVELAGSEVLVNTATMAEGRYTVRAVGRLAQEGTPEISDVETLIVDRTPPTAQITYPAVNQAFCPIRVGNRIVVPMEGVAQDPNFLEYTVEFGVGDTPTAWVPVPAVDSGRGARSGILANWDVTDLPAGTYSLRLKVYDKGGNLSCSTVTFFLPARVPVQDVGATTRLLSPNGDGASDSTTITYRIAERALISAKVHAIVNGQRAAAPVRTLTANAQTAAGVHTLTWDGLGDGGAALADGRYALVVTAGDACGNGHEGVVEIVLDTTPPEAVIASPAAGSVVSIVADVRGTVNDPHFASYRLEVGATHAPVSWTALRSGVSPVQNALLGTWPASGEPGPYTLRLTAVDAAGNSREVLVPLTRGTTAGLVTALAAEPSLFSPNGDQRLDVSTVTYGTGADARIRLELVDASDVVVKVLSESDALAGGSYTFAWDGRNQAAAVVADGAYSVRLTATSRTDATQVQVERTTVVVDSTAPVVAVATPSDASFVRGDVVVTGTAADARLDSYAVSYASPAGTPVPFEQGRQSRTDFAFGTLPQLADGRYSLTIASTDLAQNTATRTVAFTVDNTAPEVSIVAPVAPVLAGGSSPVIDVRGTLADANLASWTLRFGAGSEPQAWTPLATGTSAPAASQSLAAWNVGTLADGVYTLSLLATDRAGAAGEARVPVTVDRTPPTARILLPAANARIGAAVEIRGDAADANFESARLEFSEGDAASAFRYVTLAEIASSVTNGLLYAWQALPPDGVYTLRLTVRDRLGHTAEAKTTVTVDTEPPSRPASLTGTVENRRNARLTWTASTAADVAGYHVYRDAVRITPTAIEAITYLDANLAEGRYRYTVKTVDRSGLESAASNEVTLRIDLSAPAARITSPAAGSRVSGLVDIRGTAAAEDDFREYRVLVGDGATPPAFTLVRRSPTPIVGGVLAEFDAAGRAQGSVLTFRLESEDLDGNTAAEQVTVTVDNVAPAAPVLTSATASGANVTVVWQAGSEPDLAGYLLYNNDLLANARRIVSGDLKPYLVTGTSYIDRALADGRYEYYAFAMDTAGNVSPTSNTLTVTVETRAPRATIVQPANNAKTEHSVLVVATTPDLDVARVQFQFRRTGVLAWTNLGAADTTAPFEVTWDPAGLAFGNYEFRAVATDTGNRTDTQAPSITIRLGDLTPPAPPLGLTALVNASAATLTWQAVPAADLAGYAVYRQRGTGAPVKITASPIAATTFTNTPLSDDDYVYTVRAVDRDGNESEPSAPAPARVHTPLVSAQAACTPESTTSIAGGGATPGSTVQLFAGTGAGAVLVATTDAGVEGTFAFQAVPLDAGSTTFTVQAIDAVGNVSKRSAALVVTRSAAPPAPTGFGVSVSGFDVTLTWDANASVPGFVLARNGEVLNPREDVTHLASPQASSEASGFTSAVTAVDGEADTGWMPAADDPQPWLEIEFPEHMLVARLDLRWAENGAAALMPPSSYDVQRWDGAAWTTVREVRENTAAENVITLAPPVSAAKVRVINLAAAEDASVQLLELQAFRRVLITGSSHVDAGLDDGRYTYTLAAVNSCGLEGAAAQADAVVGDVSAPDAPTALAASVDGSTVALTWTGVAGGDLAGYNVYRRSLDGEWIEVNAEPIATPTFVDVNVPNGSYRYRVTAADAAGNESAPSNEVAATVAVAPPTAPAGLVVTVPAVGAALDLAWETVPVAFGYRVFRSAVAGGPYELVSPVIDTTTFRDAGLENGTRYYYVVRASDAAGNLSQPTAEASGVPADSAAPAAPVLLFPTDSEHPRTMAASVTFITGLAEPGSTVTLLSDGLTIGSAQAATTTTVDVVANPGAGSTVTVVPADALVASFGRPESSGPTRLLLASLLTGTQTIVDGASGGGEVAFTRDGRTIAYRVGTSLQLFDRLAGAVTRTIQLSSDDARNFRFSPDGTKLAFVTGTTGAMALRVADLSAGTSAVLVANVWTLLEPVWAPDGSALTYSHMEVAATSVRMVNVATAAVTVIDAAAAGYAASFSPDGARIAYTARRNGHDEVWIYDVASGLASPLVDDGAVRRDASFSHDGAEIVFYQVNGSRVELHVRHVATGADTMLLPHVTTPRRPAWLLDRGLVIASGQQAISVRRAGQFELPAIALPFPENRFSAVATDASGNSSAPAAPISLLREAQALTDLVTGDNALVAYPRYPLQGELVRLTATVRNVTDLDAHQVVIAFYSRSAQGELTPIGTPQTVPVVEAHQQVTVSADWQPTDALGAQTLLVRVDPANAIQEISDLNNEGRAEVLITADGAPLVTVASDLPSYPASAVVTVNAEATNPGAPADFVLELRIEDELGFLVTPLRSERLDGFGHASRRVSVTWDSTGVLPGAYRARAILRRVQGGETSAESAFSMLGERVAQASVTSDRAAYAAGEVVRLTAAVRNTSATSDLGLVTVVTRVLDAIGVEVFRSQNTIALLASGMQADLPAQWVAAAGSYAARVSVTADGQEIAAATTTFTVTGVARLSGRVAALPSPAALGSPVTIDAAATNSGTLAITSATLRLRVLDIERQVAVRSVERSIDLAAGATVPWEVPTTTDGLDLKNYSLLLELQEGASVRLLASGILSVVDRQAPAVTIASPAAGAFFNADVAIQALVSDTASGVARVEYRIDEGAWTTAAATDAASGRYAATFAAATATEGPHTIAVRAFDRAGNGDATSTADANPVVRQFIVDLTAPEVVVAGVEDGGRYPAAVTPQIQVEDANLETWDAHLDGQPFVSGTPVAAQGNHVLAVTARDRAGNVTSRALAFVIGENQPPVAQDQTVGTAEDSAVDVVLVASDPDGDATSLVYAVAVAPEHGTLSGEAPNLTYTPNADYHGSDSFTFTASDGQRVSAPATVTIGVTPVNDAPIANAGADTNADQGDVVHLDGTASLDLDGDALTFTWTQVSGTSTPLDLSDPARPAFVAPDVVRDGETLTYQLVVSDGELTSAPATVNVRVKDVNHAPQAEAGADQTVREGTSVTIDGTASFDPDGDLLTFAWQQTAGPAVELPATNTAQITFVAPEVGRTDVVLTFRLTVGDGLATATDTVTVRVQNQNHTPVADAGPDQAQDEGVLVTLDGSASSDPDGDELGYAWTQVRGPAVTLIDAGTATPTFTAPLVAAGGEQLAFRLVVNDGIDASAPDEVTVTVRNVNDPPSCSAARPSVDLLWPPKHQLVPVTIDGISNATITITGVMQDEPTNGLGDGDTGPDAVLQGSTVLLRAERQGSGDGRVYILSFVARDGAGATCTGAVSVGVPQANRRPPVDSGTRHDSTRP